MRLSILPLLLTGASIFTLAAAEPIRVVDKSTQENANIRFGHALANANVNGNDDNVARIVHPPVLLNTPIRVENKGHRSCGDSLREKTIRLSNALRHALGMPLIQAEVKLPKPGRIHILPANYVSHNVIIGTQEGEPEEPGKGPDDGGDGDDDHHKHHRHHGHHHRHHRHHHHRHHKNFLRRIHGAIKALGPWEGRAVAFVLGCGIGVLLRMFWVLTILAYRTVRGEREETLTFDDEYFVYEHVPEDLFVPPPQYVDEKVREEANEETEERK